MPETSTKLYTNPTFLILSSSPPLPIRYLICELRGKLKDGSQTKSHIVFLGALLGSRFYNPTMVIVLVNNRHYISRQFEIKTAYE